MSDLTFQDLSTIFAGRLEHLSLFDVAHFALSKRLSGVLRVTCGDTEGRLQFKQGQLLTVEDNEGGADQETAVRLFQWTKGSFEFDKVPVDPTGRIELGTENFLLEIARLVDEQRRHEAEETEEAPSEIESLLSKKPGAEFMKLLRQLDDAREEERSKPRNEFETLLQKAVGAHGTAVWLRVGSVPRTWRGPKPLALSKEPLDAATFESLARCVFGDPAPVHAACEHTYDAGSIGLFRVEFWPGCPGPTMLAHRLTPAIPTFDQLGLATDALSALCAHRSGLVLIGGVHGVGKSSVAAAMIDSINATSPRSICAFEATPRYLHRDRMGVVQQQALDADGDRAGEALRIALRRQPDLLVADPVEAPAVARHLLTEAENGRLSIGVVCAPSVEAVLLAFAAGIGPDETAALARTQNVLRGLVFLSPTAEDQTREDATRVLHADDIKWDQLAPSAASSS